MQAGVRDVRYRLGTYKGCDGKQVACHPLVDRLRLGLRLVCRLGSVVRVSANFP